MTTQTEELAQALARAYAWKDNSSKELDSTLIKTMVYELNKLDLVSRSQLLNEIKAKIDEIFENATYTARYESVGIKLKIDRLLTSMEKEQV